MRPAASDPATTASVGPGPPPGGAGEALSGAGVVGAGVGEADGLDVGGAVVGGAVVGGDVGLGVGGGVGATVGTAVGGRAVVGTGVGVAGAITRTVPVIAPWIRQRYSNVPAVFSWTVLLCPIASTPVSNAPADVAVCWAGSRFVQVTVSPTLTLTACGRKRKPSMATVADAAWAVPASAATHASSTSALRTRPNARLRIARTIGSVPATSAPFAALAREASRLGVALSAGQVSACERFANELIERNTSVNLTAITTPADIATKHFLDSFTAAAARRWTGRERIVDVGSGAGFPGLALRIAIPGSSAALVESVGKKARWLEAIAKSLGLERVTVHNARAEALGNDEGHRERYDVGTARAVGSIADCVEYLLPLLVLGGDAIVWKGKVDAELPAAARACLALGGEISAIVPTSAMGLGELLPGRHLVVVRKMRATPRQYPRSATEIKRRPW